MRGIEKGPGDVPSVEEHKRYMRNEFLDKLEKTADIDESTNTLETLSLAHSHIVRIFNDAMHADTLKEHRRLMTEGSKQWLRYESVVEQLEEEED